MIIAVIFFIVIVAICGAIISTFNTSNGDPEAPVNRGGGGYENY